MPKLLQTIAPHVVSSIYILRVGKVRDKIQRQKEILLLRGSTRLLFMKHIKVIENDVGLPNQMIADVEEPLRETRKLNNRRSRLTKSVASFTKASNQNRPKM